MPAPTQSDNSNPSHPHHDPVIRVVGAHKHYRLGDRDVRALAGIDLTIPGPGFYAIMGASGSGKSTLLHLLSALDKPDQGEVRISGQNLASMSEKELTLFRRRRIGIVFQQFNLIPTLTAAENVELPGMLAGDDPATLRARSSELLAALGLNGRSGHRPDALSGGEQQRVAIARALLFKPRLLLADEPTGNLDSASSKRLWALLAQIAQGQAVAGNSQSGGQSSGQSEGMTIVMVTHEPAAAAYCKRVFVLMDGAMRGHFDTPGDPEAVGVVATQYQNLVSAHAGNGHAAPVLAAANPTGHPVA